MKKLFIYFLLLLAIPTSSLAQTTVGTDGTYTTLFEAFTAVNEGNLKGDVVLHIISSITESQTAVLYYTGYNGTADYTSVTVYPDATGYVIGGDIDGPLIDLNGASNVTIDGRVGASGSAKDLAFTNISTGTSASTVQFSESATSNTLKYCIIKGAATSAASGIIFFSTVTAGSVNARNSITNNDITSDDAGRPINVVYSNGTSGSEISGDTIKDNNIYNFLRNGTASNGILLSSNTTSFTISGNSFYETASFAPSAAVTYNIIRIENTAGTGFTISGNNIGGSSASCGGSPWTKTNAYSNTFIGISLNVGTGAASNIQGNIIKNFVWANSSLTGTPWTAINILGGAVNIGGPIAGNTIGVTTGTGSIRLTNGGTGQSFYGINIQSTGTVDCQYNSIGSITVANASTTNATHFFGINKSNTSGTTDIRNNTIGSTSTENSINASSASTGAAQNVYGINNSGTGTVTISENTIAKMINGTINGNTATTGRINGISSTNGSVSISNNTIYDLTIGNANNTNSQTASICGLALIGNSLPKNTFGNTIYNLSNTYPSFAGSVIGIFFIGSTGTNPLYGNFIHSLSVTGASSTTASIYGINISTGATTYSNNIISLGGTSKTTIYGIYETGLVNNNNSLYFNTVYIGGDGDGGTNKSYALYSAVTTNTRNFRNNIFVNARSTTSGSNLHYSAYIVSAGGSITCDYNNYLSSGTAGAILGFYGVNKTALPIVTSQDVSSFAINPVFSSPGGTVPGNYLPSVATLVAVTGTNVTTDYDGGAARSSTYPSMGAFEYTVAPGAWTWTGYNNNLWSVANNWNYNTVPPSTGIVIIPDVTTDPTADGARETPAECQDLTINTGAVLTIAAEKALKVNGTLTNYAGTAGLILRSSGDGKEGHLINNTASVNGTVELYTTGGTGGSGPIFHYIVPPVSSMTIVTSTDSLGDARTSLGLNSTNFRGDLMAYSESIAGSDKNKGWQYFDCYLNTVGFSSLSGSTGYNFRLAETGTATFRGALNATEKNFTLSKSAGGLGWNLVGNPYPCNYNLNGISLLTGTGDGVDNTVYFSHDGGYAYRNLSTHAGTTGYNDTVPAMQGFFVLVSSDVTGPDTRTLILPVGSKEGGTAMQVRAKGADIIQKIKLVLKNNSVRDETIVCLIDKATSGFDGDYDAYKLFGGGSAAPSIYTDLNSIKYAINSVQQPGTENVIIPVTVVLKSQGTYTINITEFENLEGIKVVLKHGTRETVLNKNTFYSFTSASGTYTDFQLIIGNTLTSKDDLIKETFKTWYSNNYLYISFPDEIAVDKGSLVIYDLQGKPVYTDNLIYVTPGQTTQLPVNLQKGIYMTRITVNKQQFVSKIVVL